MERRDFLAAGLSACAAAVVGCGGKRDKPDEGSNAGTTSRPPRAPSSRGRVVVVGAGMAGIAAAGALQRTGFEVVVVEGRHRIGGRIRTDRSLGAPVDLGASWIHGIHGNPLVALAKRHSAEHVATDYDDVVLYEQDGSKVSARDAAKLQTQWNELLAEVGKLRRRARPDESIEAAINRVLSGEALDPKQRAFLQWRKSTLVVTNAEDLSKLSLRGGDDSGFGGGDRMFPGGYDQLVTRLARGLNIHLGRTVTKIGVRKDRVRIDTAGQSYEADAALVTLPIGVLQAGTVTFDPPLDAAKQRALKHLGSGVVNKLALRFPRTFWPSAHDFVAYMARSPGEFPVFLNLAKHSGKPVLVGFTGGSYARALEAKSDAEAADVALRVLRTMFGNRIPSPDAAVMTRWGWNPLSRCSYSHIRPGGSGADFDALAKPAGDRLYFAGEATIRAHPGTVHGAYLSGLREAERMTTILRKSGTTAFSLPAQVAPAAKPHPVGIPVTGPTAACNRCHE